MAPAADVMREALTASQIIDAVLPVFCNVTAAAECAADKLRDNLVKQVTARVRWRESLIAMQASGCRRYVELGTGKVLSGLVKRSLEEVKMVELDVRAMVRTFPGSGITELRLRRAGLDETGMRLLARATAVSGFFLGGSFTIPRSLKILEYSI